MTPWTGGVVLAVLLAAPAALAQPGACAIADPMTREAKRECVKSARFFLDQPTLSTAQVLKGPDAEDGRHFPPDTDVPRLADFFLTGIQGLRVMAKAGPDRRRLAGVVETALAVLP